MSSHYIDKVPKWPEFSIIGDEVSGSVPVTQIGSWRELPSLLENSFFNRPKTQLIYRGHRCYNWSLTPSLGRLDSRNIITKKIATAQLQLFRRAVRGRISDRSLVEESENYELWSVGQHHGLMTPLLDWTYSPYVALFFAFEKEDNSERNLHRAIFMLNKTYIEADERCPSVHVLEPRKDDHGRLVNQAGLFTYTDYENTLENYLLDSLKDEVLGEVSMEEEVEKTKELAKYICKIYIPNQERTECLQHLRMMNVHHASLFPDLLGAAQYCNLLMEQDTTASQKPEFIQEVKTEKKSEIAHIEESANAEVLVQVKTLREILDTPTAASGLKPALLDIIAGELAEKLSKINYVDWDKRESAKASMRNIARGVLRRHGYPTTAVKVVISKLLGTIKFDTPVGTKG